MFDKLTLRNFQPHDQLIVKLGRITIIFGESDCGKSSFVRSIRHGFLNVLTGCRYIRRGQDEDCIIDAVVDGHSIRQVTSKKDRRYILDRTREFKALRGGVPPEIAAILNVSPFTFQRQHDDVFWFSASAPEVARQLNAIVNLDAIDYVFESLAAKNRKNNQDIEVAKDRLVEIDKSLADIEPMEIFKQELDLLDGLTAKAEAKKDRLDKLSKLTDSLKRLRESGLFLTETLKYARQLKVEFDGYFEKDAQRDKLVKKIDLLKKTREAKQSLPFSSKDLEAFIADLKNKDDIKTRKDRLFSIVETLGREIRNGAENENDLTAMKREFKTIYKGCPLCGSKTGKQ